MKRARDEEEGDGAVPTKRELAAAAHPVKSEPSSSLGTYFTHSISQLQCINAAVCIDNSQPTPPNRGTTHT